MHIMLSSLSDHAPRLAALQWCVEHDRKERFVTSDTPLVLWRTPTHRDEFEGFEARSFQSCRSSGRQRDNGMRRLGEADDAACHQLAGG